MLTPLPVPSATGLAKKRERQPNIGQFGYVGHHRKLRRADAGGGDDVLRHTLVQRQGAYERIGKDVRDGVSVQQCRHLRLAADAMHAFTDVEHEIPAFAGHEPARELSQVTDAYGLESECRKGVCDTVDRIDAVELRRLEFAVAFRQPVVPQIVGHADP
jgi:hypothetical protein